MHRRTQDYLDEICFWQCARTRLLQQTIGLREHAPEPAGAAPSREPLDELLHRCGLDALCRCDGQGSPCAPGGTGTPPPPAEPAA